MSRKPCIQLIDVATTGSNTVATNGALPLSNITRRDGDCIDLGGNSIILSEYGSNYYFVTVTATFTAPVEGVVTLNLQQNNSNVVGATGSSTVTTATTEVRSISFSKIIRTFNCQGTTLLTVVNSGVEATLSNIDVSVFKINRN